MQSSETHPSSETHFCFINNISVYSFSSLSVVIRGTYYVFTFHTCIPFYFQISQQIPAIIYAVNF